MPVLFQFDVGDIDRGACLSYLSQYPNEDEVLIPPLSYLEITGEPFFKQTDKGEVTVYPARINCNLKSQVRQLIAYTEENTFCRAHQLQPTCFLVLI
jgi:hypothetical protein